MEEIENKVKRFAEIMQIELKLNSHKGNWENFTEKKEIISEYFYHFNKLENSILLENKELIKEHIADCANLLLMLGNSYEIY